MQIDVWGFKDLRILRTEDLKTNTAHMLIDNSQVHFNFPVSSRVWQTGSSEVKSNKDFTCVLEIHKPILENQACFTYFFVYW